MTAAGRQAEKDAAQSLREDPEHHANLITSFGALASSIDGMAIAELRKLLQQVQLMVTVTGEMVKAELNLSLLAEWVGVDIQAGDTIALAIATHQTSWGHEPRLRLDPPAAATACDPNLVQLIARGFAARDQLLAMNQQDVTVMPATQLRHLERIARLAYLAPDIITSILDGRHQRSAD